MVGVGWGPPRVTLAEEYNTVSAKTMRRLIPGIEAASKDAHPGKKKGYQWIPTRRA